MSGPSPLVPARLAFTADGVPYSEQYGDVYHSSDGGLGQAHHVFLAGNGLPGRWRGHERFVVVETGFGLGLNFLATWGAWRDDPQRSTQLHFVSCELHPFERAALAQLHARWPAFAELAAQLQAAWPPLVPGVHRLHLDDGRVQLTLYFGDATVGLGQLDARADAFYLDGFSPAKNPALWSPRLCHQLAALAAPGATLATWSVSGSVREHLRHAGFELEKAAGFGGKREMLRGHHPGRHADTSAMPPAAQRSALVLGAGVAGTSAAERLAARGWTVHVIDAADRPGQGASGNHAGVLRPLPSLDDNRMSRLTRAGTLYGLRHLARLAALGRPVRSAACGVLHLARDSAQLSKMRAVVERHQWPTDFLRFVDGVEASALCGWPVPLGGWWFQSSGWVQPHDLCAANLAVHPERIRTHFGRRVARLEADACGWQAVDTDGAVIARAAVAILAGGIGLREFPQSADLPLVAARGQVSQLPANADSAPRVVVCRMGYVTPAIDGVRCAGATFSVDDAETGLRDADHAENLLKLDAMLPGYTRELTTDGLGGRVGFRPASPDRLPMVGALPVTMTSALLRSVRDVPRQSGLYAVSGFGARGLVWAALMGEMLACQLDGEPLPLERDLCDAVDPARFVLRPARPLRSED